MKVKASAEQFVMFFPKGWSIKQHQPNPVIVCEPAPSQGGYRVFIRMGRQAARLVWEDVAPGAAFPAACVLDDAAVEKLAASLQLRLCGPAGKEKE